VVLVVDVVDVLVLVDVVLEEVVVVEAVAVRADEPDEQAARAEANARTAAASGRRRGGPARLTPDPS